MRTPLISIITVVYNNRDYIADAVESVLSQTYDNIEYIVIDGNSTDGTLEILETYRERIDTFVSEPDDGLYDAMNKGIERATGEIVGILNSDDFYEDDHVIEDVVEQFRSTESELVHGNLVFVQRDAKDKISRYWRSRKYRRSKFEWGWMPAHPTVFVRRRLYEEYGTFRLDLDVAADYEWLFRVLYRQELQTSYIDRVMVRMRLGGNSGESIGQLYQALKDVHQTWKLHDLDPPLKLVPGFILWRIPQLFRRPPAEN